MCPECSPVSEEHRSDEEGGGSNCSNSRMTPFFDVCHHQADLRIPSAALLNIHCCLNF
jgi:hypothetical protein